MKKIFIALSVIAAATFGVNAQNPSAKTVCPQAPCPNVKAGDKARCTAPNPFEGLNLTEQQQKKIDELRQATRQQKLANDSIRKANRDQKMRDFKNKRSEYLKSVKAILTPEQYVQFLRTATSTLPAPVMAARTSTSANVVTESMATSTATARMAPTENNPT